MCETKKGKVIYFVFVILASVLICAGVYAWEIHDGLEMLTSMKQALEIFALCIFSMFVGFFLEES